MTGRKKPLLTIEQVSSEQEIAEIQLARLREISRERMLSYEEVKIFDLLTKNLNIAKQNVPSIPATSRQLDNNIEDTKELLQMADVITEDHAKSVLNITQDESIPTKEEP